MEKKDGRDFFRLLLLSFGKLLQVKYFDINQKKLKAKEKKNTNDKFQIQNRVPHFFNQRNKGRNFTEMK